MTVSSRQLPVVPSSEVVVSKKTPLDGSSFREVYQGRIGGETVAVEILHQESDELSTCFQAQEQFITDMEMLMGLHHPNIVRFKGVLLDPPSIVTEYCPNGTLYGYLRRKEYSMDSGLEACRESSIEERRGWGKRLKLMLGIASGMSFLHERQSPIIHGNLKSTNIVLKKDNIPAIADFGMTMHKGVQFEDQINPSWQAPEVASGNGEASLKSDVYSFAIIMWEVLTGERPWLGIRPVDIYHELDCKQRPPVPEELPSCWVGVTEYVHLMTKCWAENPNDRPSFMEIIHELVDLEKKVRWSSAQNPESRRLRKCSSEACHDKYCKMGCLGKMKVAIIKGCVQRKQKEQPISNDDVDHDGDQVTQHSRKVLCRDLETGNFGIKANRKGYQMEDQGRLTDEDDYVNQSFTSWSDEDCSSPESQNRSN